MSKLKCKCGYIIADNSEDLPYKAIFIRDQDSPHEDKFLKDLMELIKAAESGKTKEWFIEYFGDSKYGDSNTYFNLLYMLDIRIAPFQSDMFLCESCGRIHIQRRISKYGDYSYLSFMPEDDDWKGLLKGSNEEDDMKRYNKK